MPLPFSAILILVVGFVVQPALWASDGAPATDQQRIPTGEPPPSAPSPPAWRWGLILRNRTGYRLEPPRVFQMSRSLLDLKGIGRLNERWGLILEGRAHYDPVGRLGYPTALWLDARQFLLDGRAGPVSLSLGLQQIVWGQADGLRILDVINPLDYREFILEDFIDSRRPLWMVRADLPIFTLGSLQVVWIPYFAPGRVPVLGNEFALGTPIAISGQSDSVATVIPPPIALQAQPVRRPPYQLRSSQAGLRWSRTLRGWDLSANVFHGWEDIATPEIRPAGPAPLPKIHSPLNVSNGGGRAWPAPAQAARSAEVTGHYERKTVLGGTAANSFGPFVLRAEAGWTAHRPVAVTSFPRTAFFERLGQFAGVIGLDYSLRPWLWTSGQYFLQLTSAPQSRLILPRNAQLFSLYVRAELLRDTLRPELFVLAGLNQRQFLIRPRIIRVLGDHWTLGAGADLFAGRPDTLLGSFADRDRAVLELKWFP